MTLVLSTKTVTARKPHRCSTCGVECIQPGDTYTRQATLNDGRVYDWVTCDPCQTTFDDVWEWAGSPYDEGIGPDTYAEWAHEWAHYDDRAVAYLARAGAGRA